MSYQVCGTVFVGKYGVSRRCYGRGQSRYGGRCHHCRGVDYQPQGPRCGFPRADGKPCASLVGRVGRRCERHREDALREARLTQRRELRETLERLTKQRAQLERRIASVREKLGALGVEVAHAAE